MGVPSFAVRRYLLSQISSEASWKGTESMSLGSIFTTVFMDGRRSAIAVFSPGPFPRNEESDARRAGHPVEPPPTLRYCIASAKHKILCRGQKIRDAFGPRQYLRADSVTL